MSKVDRTLFKNMIKRIDPAIAGKLLATKSTLEQKEDTYVDGNIIQLNIKRKCLKN